MRHALSCGGTAGLAVLMLALSHPCHANGIWVVPSVDPGAVTLTAVAGADRSSTATVYVSATPLVGAPPPSISIYSDVPWLPLPETVPNYSFVQVQATVTGMAPGTHVGQISVPGFGYAPAVCTVTLQIAAFPDAPAGSWAWQEIVACADQRIVLGYPDGLYHPEIEVTRDQMAVYVARALVSPSGDAAIPDPGPPPTFTDVLPDFWAYKQIEYAVSQNVVQGYPNGTYQPALVVDRGQMAVYVARAMVAPTGDAAIADPEPPFTFPDVPGEDNTWAWCHKHVEFLAGWGVVTGYPDGLYHPENAVTRDQMAVYIARAFELL